MNQPRPGKDVEADAMRPVGAHAATDDAGFPERPRFGSGLRAALTTLTRLPVTTDSAAGAGARAFGVVGATIGLIALIPLVALGPAAPPVAAILAVVAMAVVSGAIHLDGLADTADALVALGPDGAERARKDPAIGVGGAAAIVLVLGLEVASLALLVTGASPLAAGLACVVAGAASRVVPVVLVRLARSRVSGVGMGAWFAARTTTVDAAIAVGSAVIITLAAALILGAPALLTAGVFGGLGGAALGLGLVRARSQLDGDLLGASVELAFALTLAAAATLVAWPSS